MINPRFCVPPVLPSLPDSENVPFRLASAIFLRVSAAIMVDEKAAVDPMAEKPEDLQNEFETSSKDKAAVVSVLNEDADTKALTRKLLWKLDSRYVACSGKDPAHHA